MSKRSHQDLIELARPLLKQHGTLSTSYLIRKLKVDYEEALKIMNALGVKTREQEVDEFVQRAKDEMKEEVREHFSNYQKRKRDKAIQYNRSDKGKISIEKGWKKRAEIMKRLTEGLGDVERWKIRAFYKACPKECHVDHIIPVSKGGNHRLENLQYLPIEQNRRKFTKSQDDAKTYFEQLSI
jgi:hypothetical protein